MDAELLCLTTSRMQANRDAQGHASLADCIARYIRKLLAQKVVGATTECTSLQWVGCNCPSPLTGYQLAGTLPCDVHCTPVKDYCYINVNYVRSRHRVLVIESSAVASLLMLKCHAWPHEHELRVDHHKAT